ncbi:MAG: SPOR domain-containing protein [Bacteroidales bacterium]|nr:SPOR domain-containing protein [Bacteroidales bacterium]
MEEYILDILEKNNRVIIPEFGALIVKQRKPFTVVFNEFLQYNDGMLVGAISKKNEINRDAAKKELDDFVTVVKETLNKGEKYVLSGLGTLVKSSTGKISLESSTEAVQPKSEPQQKKTTQETKKTDQKIKKSEPEKETSAPEIKKEEKKVITVNEKAAKSKEVVGKSKEIELSKDFEETGRREPVVPETKEKEEIRPNEKPAEEKKEPVTQPLAEEQPKKEETVNKPVSEITSTDSQFRYTEPTRSNRKRNIIIWLIVIIVVNGLIVTYFIKSEELAGIFKKNRNETEILSPEPLHDEQELPEQDIESDIDKPEAIQEVSQKPVTKEPAPVIQGTKYYVVAGVFSNETNADNLVIDLRSKGYKAEKFGKIGKLHAVSYDVFSSKNEADRMMRKIQAEQNPEAWIKAVD